MQKRKSKLKLKKSIKVNNSKPKRKSKAKYVDPRIKEREKRLNREIRNDPYLRGHRVYGMLFMNPEFMAFIKCVPKKFFKGKDAKQVEEMFVKLYEKFTPYVPFS